MKWRLGLIRPIGLIGPIGLIRPMGLIGLIGLIGLMGLIGCSQEAALPDEVPASAGTAITFLANQGEETVTRATPLEQTTDRFVVWGYKNDSYDDVAASYTSYQSVMPAYSVRWVASTANTTTSNTHDWEYVGLGTDQTIKYWDWSANAYRFFATTKFNSASVPETPADYEALGAYGAYKTSGDDQSFDLTMLADGTTAVRRAATPYYSKLWFSNNSDGDPDHAYGHTVQMLFMQPFARVRFMFVQSNPDAVIMLTDKHFSPTDGTKVITTKGIYRVSYPLTGTATQESCSVERFMVTENDELVQDPQTYITEMTEEYYETPSDAGARRWYWVLPHSGQGSYTMRVKVNGVEKSTVVPAQYTDWLAGYQYTYIFKITDEGGVEIDMVQSAFTDWSRLENERTVYNW